MKLEEFRLMSYDERADLLQALTVAYPGYARPDRIQALIVRLSRVECQPGGCEYCNIERVREANEQ